MPQDRCYTPTFWFNAVELFPSISSNGFNSPPYFNPLELFSSLGSNGFNSPPRFNPLELFSSLGSTGKNSSFWFNPLELQRMHVLERPEAEYYLQVL